MIYYLLLRCSLVSLSGDIKTNPGPISSFGQCLPIWPWNLNTIAALNYAKLSLLTACNLVHSFDIICLSERYINSQSPPNDTLKLPDSFRSDHPSNNKTGGVYIYYKPNIKTLNISNLDESINFEVSIANKNLTLYPAIEIFQSKAGWVF